MWPRSRFARVMAHLEKYCPMCRAYRALRQTPAARPKDSGTFVGTRADAVSNRIEAQRIEYNRPAYR
jgi:hypothetical protein